MSQQEFNELSKRYLEGKTSEEEEKYLLEWWNKQPQFQLADFDEVQRNKIEKRVWKNITKQIRFIFPINIQQLSWISGIAASLLMVFFLANKNEPVNKIIGQFSSAKIKEKEGIEIKNTTSAEQEVKLEDGTVVLLKQKSTIVYDKTFNQDKREVFLTGEAFFKVKRDVTRPFIVHTGTLVTEVLGTSFRIKPNPVSNLIEVAVTTGRVSVYLEKTNIRNERTGIILTPNQRVIFNENSQNITPSLVENPVPIVAIEGIKSSMNFQVTPLNTVLNTLSTRYGIEFVITNPNSKNCQITADLNGLSMFTQLELICKSIDATYEKRGTVVFINGEGCD